MWQQRIQRKQCNRLSFYVVFFFYFRIVLSVFNVVRSGLCIVCRTYLPFVFIRYAHFFFVYFSRFSLQHFVSTADKQILLASKTDLSNMNEKQQQQKWNTQLIMSFCAFHLFGLWWWWWSYHNIFRVKVLHSKKNKCFDFISKKWKRSLVLASSDYASGTVKPFHHI